MATEFFGSPRRTLCARCVQFEFPIATRGLLVLHQHGRTPHQVVDASAFFLKIAKLLARELALARNLDRKRIDELIVDQHFEVQVRACRQARCADVADQLRLSHLGSNRDAGAEALHVAIGRVVAVGVPDANVIAVVPLSSGFLDDAGT